MRTTLTIDDDVLRAAKQLARERNSSLGEALSELARRGLTQRHAASTRNGIALVPLRPEAATISLQEVNELRDEVA